MTADFEFMLMARLIELNDIDDGLHRKLWEMEVRAFNYAPMQNAEYELARVERRRELAPSLAKLIEDSRPYWETHGTLVVHHGPDIREIVMLMEVPQNMFERYPQFAPVPRQEELRL